MKKNVFINELLAIKKDALKGLHETEGFDFEQPFVIMKYTGKFTLNQVRKGLEAMGHNPYTMKVIIALNGGDDDDWFRSRWHYVKLTARGFDIDKSHRGGYGNNCLDTFCVKYDFEHFRKSDTGTAYIIAQDTEYLNYETARNSNVAFLEPWERVKIKATQHYNEYAEKYYTRYDYNFLNGEFVRDNYSIDPDLDKSGYNVDNERRRLRHKAIELREEREKAEYLKQDNTAKVTALEELIKSLKAEIIEAFTKANTYKEIKEVVRRLDRWQGFTTIVERYERFKERTESKDYRSIESSDEAYNSIMNAILNYNA